MVLQFKFKYLSNDKTLAKFLEKAAKEFGCLYKILKEGDYLSLYLESLDENLEEYANSLSSQLPMSIFYYDIKVDILSAMPKEDSMSLLQDKNISFCPSCLKEVEDENSKFYYDAFKSCNICDGFNTNSFIFENKKVESDKELFEEIAKLINDNKKIKIKTLSGTFVFSKVSNINESKNLLTTNLRNISKVMVENKTEVVALASIEKPSIDLKINEIFKHKHNIEKEYIDVRFANDLTLYLLSLELMKYDIDFLNIEDEENEYDYFLDVNLKTKSNVFIDIPKIKCIDNRKVFLHSKSYPKSLDVIYNKFKENDKSHLMTVLSENDLFEKSILNFYLSSCHEDGISLYSTKFDGLIDIVKPLYIPSTIQEVFDEISKDETGSKLVSNYKEKFEAEYTKAVNTDISNLSAKSLSTYWHIAKIALDFNEGILNNANSCLLEKGPRIDYKLKENDKIYNREFDYAKLIKSAISFKLAGVDEVTISLGYMESLAHFIANEIDLINSSYDLDGVSLCGDMFSNELFSKLVEKSITKNFKIYYNREFVIQK